MQAARPADARNTFGDHRFGILAALANAGALVLVVGFIGVEAIQRLRAPEAVTPWIMALAAACFVLTALRPGLTLMAPLVVLFSAGSGAYQAVDWALAIAVLPSSASAGKDMGIWHISMVLPQIIGPAATGWIISGLTLAISARFAYLFAFCLAAACFILAAWLIRKVRLPAPA